MYEIALDAKMQMEEVYLTKYRGLMHMPNNNLTSSFYVNSCNWFLLRLNSRIIKPSPYSKLINDKNLKDDHSQSKSFSEEGRSWQFVGIFKLN